MYTASVGGSGRGSRIAGPRWARLWTLFSGVAVASAMLVCCAQSWGLGGRGHVLGGVIAGSGEAALHDPTGVAVDEATGEVFVVDHVSPHERVERFRRGTSGEYEFSGSFEVKSPEAIAVDNSEGESRGDVYVVGAAEEGAPAPEHNVLYKYSPEAGKVLFKKSLFKAKGAELELEDIRGLAVDGSGTLWVYWGEEGVVSAFSDAKDNLWQPSLTKELQVESRFGCQARDGFAVAPDDSAFYAAYERENGLEECAEGEGASLIAKFQGAGAPVARAMDEQPSSGVAVEAGGQAYVDNESSIAAFSSGGALVQRFGAGELTGSGALAVDAKDGLVLVAEPAAGSVSVFASEGAGSPMVDGVYAQNVEAGKADVFAEIDPHGEETEYEVQYGTSSCLGDPSPCSGKVLGKLPAGYGDTLVKAELTGLEANTTYYYRVLARSGLGIAESPQSGQTFFTTLPSSQGLLADGREWELVSPTVMHGAAVEPISREGALIQAAADGGSIAWAASAPVGGEGEGDRRPEPVQVLSRRGGQRWSSQSITTPHDRGEGIEPGEATEYRFFSSDLSLAMVQPQIPNEEFEDPPLAPEAKEKTIYRRDDGSGQYTPLVTGSDDTASPSVPFGGKLEFAGATPDLSHAVFDSEVPLVAGGGEAGLYEWEAGAPLELLSVLPGSGHTPAVEPELGYQGRDTRNAISTDGSRVFFGSEGDRGPLFARDTQTGVTVQANAAQGEGTREPDTQEREEGLDEVQFQGASANGSRVFFTDSWPLTPESALEPLSREEVVEEPPAGNRTVPRAVDLYEFDVETGKLSDLTTDTHVGEPADVLGTIPGASEDGEDVYFVANGVLVPGAELGDCPRSKPLLAHPGAACNLYVSEPLPGHPGQRQTRLVARLSDEDAADWGQGNSPLPGDLGGLTSRVSPNGRYLAFMSERELTGYDNVDANPAASGVHDEEVYLYDAQQGRLVCASCNPTGERPHGVYDIEDAGEGLGLVVDRPETWSGHWLAGSIPGWTLFKLANPVAEHQAQYLSNNGRLFFNSADALLAQVSARTREEQLDGKPQTVGVENVYEYEPRGEGSCTTTQGCVSLISSGTSEHESAFLDASEDGNDAFFLTAAQLVAQDTEPTLMVYDARVCGTAETGACLPVTPPPPPICNGEGCRPPASEQQLDLPAATATFSGPGNSARQEILSSETTGKPKPPTPQQKLQVALKACKKLKKKRRRSVCEARARKTYGSAKSKQTPKSKPARKRR